MTSGIPLGAATRSDDVIRDSPSDVIRDLRKGCFPIMWQIGRLMMGRLMIRAGLPAGVYLVYLTK